MGGSRKTPASLVKENLEKSDPIAFLLDRKKPLTLSDMQKDSLKIFRKEMQHMQEPLFRDMDKIFADIEKNGGEGGAEGGGSGRRGGGMGGGMGGGRRGGGMGGGGMGGDDEGADGGRGARLAAMLPDTAKTIVARLTDIQDAYRDRARGQLSDGQRHIADSLMTAILDEQRKKDEAERAKRQNRG
jgi:hypothetical protein